MRVEHIGDATLYLGDAREVFDEQPCPDTVLTDPPYGMSYRSNFRTSRHDVIEHDDDTKMLVWATFLHAKHSSYIFCRWDNLPAVIAPKSVITWVKNNWSMGDLQHEHARQTEIALFYPGPEHDFPAGRPTDVIHAPRTANEHHPTEKPVELMMQFLRWTRGSVLDPFMGSGTTGVACARMGRPFTGVEINSKYFDIACRRIEEAYKQPALIPHEAPRAEQQGLEL